MIDAYLNELFPLLRGAPAGVRRMLEETDSHLRETAGVLVEAGLSEEQAQQTAIARFGPASVVAKQFARDHDVDTATQSLLKSCAVLATTALLASALGLLLIQFMRPIATPDFVWGNAGASASCSNWLSLHPGDATCTQAFQQEAYEDGWVQMGALTIGALIMVVLLITYRRRAKRSPQLFTSQSSALSAISASVSAAVLSAIAVNRVLVNGGTGAGELLALAAAATIAAAVTGVIWRRHPRSMNEATFASI